MMETEYTGLVDPHGGQVNCSASSFTGGSRLPSFEKACYCDDSNIVNEGLVWDEVEYWEEVFAEEEARAAEAAAEAEAEAAR